MALVRRPKQALLILAPDRSRSLDLSVGRPVICHCASELHLVVVLKLSNPKLACVGGTGGGIEVALRPKAIDSGTTIEIIWI